MKVLFVGLGNMGLPMALRLNESGHDVIGYDASAQAREIAKDSGMAVASDLREAARDRHVAILMLPTSSVVEAVMEGGLRESLPLGATVVDMGSSNPVETQRQASEASSRSLAYVDAPVSGGVSGARAGSLTIMVGGEEEVVAEVIKLLEPLGSKIRHVGPVGAGHALKALNNLLSATHLLVSSEALLAGREFGLDYDVMLDVINGSSGRSASTEMKWPKYVLPETFDSGFSLALMAKDMGIAVELENSVGWRGELSEAATLLWRRAADDMPVGADHTEIVSWLRQQH